jgi:hypothetical protein
MVNCTQLVGGPLKVYVWGVSCLQFFPGSASRRFDMQLPTGARSIKNCRVLASKGDRPNQLYFNK